MNITDLLQRTGGLQSIARELGIDERQAASGAEALAPALLGGMQKQRQSRPGGLEGLLGQLGGGSMLDHVLAPQPTDAAPGNALLGQLFGSKDVSRTVAQDAAQRSGLEPSLLKRMLPLLAMVLAGALSKPTTAGAAAGAGGAAGGGLGGMLGGLLGGGGHGGGALGGLGGLGGLAGLLDGDGNGNPLDDVLRRAGRQR